MRNPLNFSGEPSYLSGSESRGLCEVGGIVGVIGGGEGTDGVAFVGGFATWRVCSVLTNSSVSEVSLWSC